MAQLVAAFGSSHSLMLVSRREDWMHGFRVIDQTNAHLFDRLGRKTDYTAALAQAPLHAADLATPELLSQRFDAAQASIDRLGAAIAAARLDVLLVVGDDQTELFRTSNNPAMAIYHGASIRNTARPPMPPTPPGEPWPRTASLSRHEPEVDRDYPVDSALARWLTRQLCNRDFDITAMDGLTPGQSEGHAFQFVHRRLLPAHIAGTLPTVPIILNTFDPPNQPTPRRCVALGAALAELLPLWPQDVRVGALASGGLSHFLVDEALDGRVLDAIRRNDSTTLAALDPAQLQAGSSEIRNWLVVAALARGLDLEWVDYIPAYRSDALTGTGLAFAAWKAL